MRTLEPRVPTLRNRGRAWLSVTESILIDRSSWGDPMACKIMTQEQLDEPAGLILTVALQEHFFQIAISQPLVELDSRIKAQNDGDIEYYPLVIIRTHSDCQELSKTCASDATCANRTSPYKNLYISASR